MAALAQRLLELQVAQQAEAEEAGEAAARPEPGAELSPAMHITGVAPAAGAAEPP